MKDFKPGDKVAWRSSAGRSIGYVKRRIIKPASVKGHTASASKEKPQYLVVSESGKEAIHKAEALEPLEPD